MSSIKISVVIPLYNKAGTISRALMSVINQSLMAAEIIVIDDGSKDHSADQVMQLIADFPNANISLHQQQNQGVSAARNLGINKSTSEYIALLDADDTYEPGFLHEIALLILAHHKAGAFCTSYRFVDRHGKVRPVQWKNMLSLPQRGLFKSYFRMAAQGSLPLSSSSVCLRKTAIEELGGFPVGQQMGEDQWLWSLIALKYPIAYSKRVLSNYFLDEQNSLMSSVTPDSELPFSQMLQDMLDHRLGSDPIANDVRAMIRTHLFDLIRRNYTQKNYTVCQTLLADSRLSWWRLRSIYWYVKCVTANSVSEQHKAV